MGWSALSPLPYPLQGDFASFVHLIAPGGSLITQQDIAPPAAFIPPRLWQPDQVARQSYPLTLPTDAPAGTYQVRAGLYNSAGRLPAR